MSSAPSQSHSLQTGWTPVLGHGRGCPLFVSGERQGAVSLACSKARGTSGSLGSPTVHCPLEGSLRTQAQPALWQALLSGSSGSRSPCSAWRGRPGHCGPARSAPTGAPAGPPERLRCGQTAPLLKGGQSSQLSSCAHPGPLPALPTLPP